MIGREGLRRLAAVAGQLQICEGDESSCKKDVTPTPDESAHDAERSGVGTPAGGDLAGGGPAADKAGRSCDDRGRG
ncbi:hypothetical protein GCM10010129_76250 [Streptomyces fumigatiscleroticus]|nr:hypothetical protein GCM10010129_76250 [Streptomyces fumigatiscleroticus]